MNNEQMIKLLSEELQREITPLKNLLTSQQKTIESQQTAINSQQQIIEEMSEQLSVNQIALEKLLNA